MLQTELAKTADVTVTDRTETTLTVYVTEAPGNWDNFSVTCEPASSGNKRGMTTCVPSTTCSCDGLTSGEKYTVKAFTTRTGFTPVKSDQEKAEITGIISSPCWSLCYTLDSLAEVCLHHTHDIVAFSVVIVISSKKVLQIRKPHYSPNVSHMPFFSENSNS